MAIERPTDFTQAVAAEVRGFLSRERINQTQVAERLGRSQAYVSERVNAKAAFDMDDIDGIASLMGMTGVELLARVAKRVAEEASRPAGRDELSDRRGRIDPSEMPHAAYDSDDGVPPDATEHDFTT